MEKRIQKWKRRGAWGLRTWAALDGDEKKSSMVIKSPRVKVVKEKSKNPEPRECIPGGLMKIDTNRSTHHRKLITAKRTVKYRKKRTLQRL